MIETLRAAPDTQIHDPYQLAGLALSIWGILIAASLIVLLWSLIRDQVVPQYIGLIWVLIVILFGPFGLLAYWFAYREPTLRQVNIPNWQRALGASLSNAAGNIMGMMLIIILFITFFPSANVGPLSLLSPLLIGWFGFRAPLYASWAGQRYWIAIRRTFLAEFLSTLLVIAFALPVIMWLEQTWVPYAWELESPLFWVKFIPAAFVGVISTYPLNLWLARNFLIWPFQAGAQQSTELPSLRSSWAALLICMVCLVASIMVAG